MNNLDQYGKIKKAKGDAVLPVALFDLYKASNNELVKKLPGVLGKVKDADVNLVEGLQKALFSYRQKAIGEKAFIERVRDGLPSKCGACGICIGPGFLETSGVDLSKEKRICNWCDSLMKERGFLQINYITRLLPNGEEIKTAPYYGTEMFSQEA